MNSALECIRVGWAPGIGDPALAGWLITVFHAVTALLCLRAARVPVGRGFWLTVAAVLALLGLNAQLDLQSLLSVSGRCAAQAQGWYGDRRLAQRLFAVALCGLLVAGVVLMQHLRHGTGRQTLLAALGLAAVLASVAGRAAGFLHLAAPPAALAWLEPLGLLLIAAAAHRFRRQIRPDRA